MKTKTHYRINFRDTLDKMHVSLIQNDNKNSYLRSTSIELERIIQNKLGIMALPQIQPEADFSL